jgi:hypothetical protein
LAKGGKQVFNAFFEAFELGLEGRGSRFSHNENYRTSRSSGSIENGLLRHN